MTTTITVRLPVELAREFKARARATKTSASAVLRQAAANYVRENKSGDALKPMQEHINARAGTWKGHCSGAELLRKTRS